MQIYIHIHIYFPCLIAPSLEARSLGFIKWCGKEMAVRYMKSEMKIMRKSLSVCFHKLHTAFETVKNKLDSLSPALHTPSPEMH